MEVTTHKARIAPLPCFSQKRQIQGKTFYLVEVHSNYIHLKNGFFLQHHCYRGKGLLL